MTVSLLYALRCSSPGPVATGPAPASLFFSAAVAATETAPTATAASAIRAALNVIGSMLSMPVRWKTKAVPQIMAVSMSKALPSIFLSLIQAPLSTHTESTHHYFSIFTVLV